MVACFLLFGACLVWPLLSIANRPTSLLGVPALVVFVAWAARVVVLIVLARRVHPPEDGT